MQGDIFQLENILSHQARDSTTPKSPVDFLTTKYSYNSKSPLIAVYNEDDISEYLYQEDFPITYTTQPVKAPLAAATDPNSQAQYSLGPCSNHYDDDECAISTDDEDSTNAEPVTPPAKIRHHHTRHIGSPPGSNLPPTRPILERRRRDDHAGQQPREQSVVAAGTVAIPQEQHVDRIEGALMSWWPMPVEQLEHEWNDRFYE
ncbi:hypothetical protein MN608_00022 [Microdochium nivale]|nr:hypothetical protein MN608_00022 [Microdochium nivale]